MNPAVSKMREAKLEFYRRKGKIHAKAVQGRFNSLRWAMVWLTQIVFYGACWLPWTTETGTRQAILFDIADDKLYLFGDFGAFCFDAKASTWTPRAKLEPMLVMPQAVGIDGVIWVIGGDQVEGDAGRLLLAYDIAKDAWRPEAAR